MALACVKHAKLRRFCQRNIMLGKTPKHYIGIAKFKFKQKNNSFLIFFLILIFIKKYIGLFLRNKFNFISLL